MASCGTLKKNLNKSKEEVKTNTVTESVATKTITEIIDTALVQKSASLTVTGDEEDLDRGEIIESENDDLILKIWKDPKTKKIKGETFSKEKKIPAKFKRVVVEKIDTKQTSNTFTKTEKKTLDKTRESGLNLIVIGFISCLFLLILLLIFYKRIKAYFTRPGA